MGANAPPPPAGDENVRLERAEDELTKTKNAIDEYFSSNLSTHAAFHSV